MQSSDIVFVNPEPMRARDGFPFGISILANVLRRDGFSVSIVDAVPDNLNSVQVVGQIENLKPSVVGFTGLWINFQRIQQISRLLREQIPRIIQLGGGWWSSPIPGIVLKETKIDYVIQGEADLAISTICHRLLDGDSIREEPGVCYLNSSGACCENNALREPQDLDQLPLPAYDLFDMSYYIWETDEKRWSQTPQQFREFVIKRFGNKRKWRWCNFYSGRGCYGACTFCSAAGKQRRNHSPAYVVDHMVKMKNEYQVEVFQFGESLTLSTNEWVKVFCREIIARGLNILYSAECRSDFNYDEETLRLLAESGCYRVLVGFESGDQTVLDLMKKRVRVEKFHTLIRDLWKHRITVTGSFILNMPGETERSLEATARFVKTSRINHASVGFASPLPRTELYRYAKNHGFIQDERSLILTNPGRDKGRGDFSAYYKNFNFNRLPARTLLTTRQRIERRLRINRFYYSNRLVYWFFYVFPILASVFAFVPFVKEVSRFFVEKGPRQFFVKSVQKIIQRA